MVQLRNLEPPDHDNLRSLREELEAGSALSPKSMACWHEDTKHDFVVLRNESKVGYNLISRVHFYFQRKYWDLRHYGKVSHLTNFFDLKLSTS